MDSGYNTSCLLLWLFCPFLYTQPLLHNLFTIFLIHRLIDKLLSKWGTEKFWRAMPGGLHNRNFPWFLLMVLFGFFLDSHFMSFPKAWPPCSGEEECDSTNTSTNCTIRFAQNILTIFYWLKEKNVFLPNKKWIFTAGNVHKRGHQSISVFNCLWF